MIRFKKLLTAVMIFLIMCSSLQTAVLAQESVSVVKQRIMSEIKKGKSERVFIKSSLSEETANNIIGQLSDKYFAYWKGEPICFTREWVNDQWFNGFVVMAKRGNLVYNINNQINKKATKVVKKYVKKGMSKKKKILAIANGISKLMSYGVFKDKSVEASTYALLKKNKGYCEIYSLIFLAACKKVKIPCELVHGTSNGTYGWDGHAWNRVKLGGSWKYVDACWYDMTRKNKKWLFKKKLWRTHKLESILSYFYAG